MGGRTSRQRWYANSGGPLPTQKWSISSQSSWVLVKLERAERAGLLDNTLQGAGEVDRAAGFALGQPGTMTGDGDGGGDGVDRLDNSGEK